VSLYSPKSDYYVKTASNYFRPQPLGLIQLPSSTIKFREKYILL